MYPITKKSIDNALRHGIMFEFRLSASFRGRNSCILLLRSFQFKEPIYRSKYTNTLYKRTEYHVWMVCMYLMGDL